MTGKCAVRSAIGFGLAVAWLTSALAAGTAADLASSRTYAVLQKGEVVFQENAKLAPNGVFQYRLYLNGVSNASAPTLKLSGRGGSKAVPLGARQVFSLPGTAEKSDASLKLMVSPASENINWRAEVSTPGLPAGTRRLGDLRLECLVDVKSNLNGLNEGKVDCMPAAAKEAYCMEDMHNCAKYVPAAVGAAVLDAIKGVARLEVENDPYEAKPFSYLFIADRPLFSVSLQQGGRRLVLPTEWLYGLRQQRSPFFHWPYPKQYLYSLPLSDASWSNDALVVFEYMDPV